MKTTSDTAMIIADGVLGVIIGAATLGLSSARSPLVHTGRFPMFLDASAVMGIMLGIPMLIATMALVPFLLRYLRRQLRLPRSSYYIRSAIAGIVFGLAASAGVGFVLGVMIPFFPSADATIPERLLMLIGAPVYLTLGAGLIGVFYVAQIIVTGTAFGLLNGWYVERHAAGSAGASDG